MTVNTIKNTKPTAILAMSCSVPVCAQGTITIDTKLVKTQISNNTYIFPPTFSLKSKDSRVCPSDHCVGVIEKDNALDGISMSLDNKTMNILGLFQLKDHATDGQLAPKDQILLENLAVYISCSKIDVSQDQKTRNTKYICPKDYRYFRRTFNDTYYPLNVSASFDMPTKELTINATERPNYS